MPERILSELWIYPIKSLGGVRVSSARVKPKGLQFDRRWMLIDEDGNFITQRKISKLALFKLALIQDMFVINYGGDQILLPLNAAVTINPTHAYIWNDEVTVYEVLGEYSNWFSRHLGFPCRLVYFPEDHPRPVDATYSLNNDQVSLADGYPFLIIGQSSLDDLNKRLKIPVSMNRFRPNFVFSGGMPYEEDKFRRFTIGRSSFFGVKQCSRCSLITVNQHTAESNNEPLATLSTYRKEGNKILFGQNLLAIDCYKIYEGDRIELE